MQSWSSYEFHHTGRLDSDETDKTQQNMQNTKFANYMLSNYVSENILSPSYIDFESRNLLMTTGNPTGPGISGDVIDVNSELTMNYVIERPFQKLDLNPRPFLTIPYLGRGSCDPDTETKIKQGEYFFDKKSVNTIMDKNFTNRSISFPVSDSEPNENMLEEAALNGWVRGGSRTRDFTQTNP